MKSLSSYLITIMAVFYWVFRVIVSLMYAVGKEFVCQPLDANLEIIILFLTIPCIILIIRRNLIVATLYFGMYAAYFGTILFNSLTGMPAETETWAFSDGPSIIATALGVIIPLLIFLDVLIQKSRFHTPDRKTDWYYENEKYDREFDQRADRNQYKIK